MLLDRFAGVVDVEFLAEQCTQFISLCEPEWHIFIPTDDCSFLFLKVLLELAKLLLFEGLIGLSIFEDPAYVVTALARLDVLALMSQSVPLGKNKKAYFGIYSQSLTQFILLIKFISDLQSTWKNSACF